MVRTGYRLDWGGREKDALAEINRAHQLSPIISDVIGDVHIMARQYDDAIAAGAVCIPVRP
jgi:hypothetical protein